MPRIRGFRCPLHTPNDACSQTPVKPPRSWEGFAPGGSTTNKLGLFRSRQHTSSSENPQPKKQGLSTGNPRGAAQSSGIRGEGAPGARHRSERPRLRAPVTLSIGFPDLLPDQPGDLRPHNVREALQPLLEGKHSGVQSSWGANEGRNRHQGTPGETLGEGSGVYRWLPALFPFPPFSQQNFSRRSALQSPPRTAASPWDPPAPEGPSGGAWAAAAPASRGSRAAAGSPSPTCHASKSPDGQRARVTRTAGLQLGAG